MPKIKPEDRAGVAQLLRHYRTALAHLSQEQLSYESKINVSTIMRIETGATATPQDGILWSLAEALAPHIYNGDPQKIYNHLLEAKKRKPVQLQIHPALLQINDLIYPLPDPKQFLIIETLLNITKAFVEFHKK